MIFVPFWDKINTSKSRLIFSKNCPPLIKSSTSQLLNITPTNSFGKYLGFLILNHKPKPTDFQHIIDNMRNKLASWKTNFLSLAGRATLAESTRNAIPTHAMQYIYFPKKFHKTIDKIQRDFIWGSNTTRKMVHCLSWDKITLPKDHGGLGLHKSIHKNTAFWLASFGGYLPTLVHYGLLSR